MKIEVDLTEEEFQEMIRRREYYTPTMKKLQQACLIAQRESREKKIRKSIEYAQSLQRYYSPPCKELATILELLEELQENK